MGDISRGDATSTMLSLLEYMSSKKLRRLDLLDMEEKVLLSLCMVKLS